MYSTPRGVVLLAGELSPGEPAVFVPREQQRADQRREAFRVPVHGPVELRRAGGEVVRIVTLDLSATGALMTGRTALEPGERVTLTIALGDQRVALPAVVTRQDAGDQIGVRFIGPAAGRDRRHRAVRRGRAAQAAVGRVHGSRHGAQVPDRPAAQRPDDAVDHRLVGVAPPVRDRVDDPPLASISSSIVSSIVFAASRYQAVTASCWPIRWQRSSAWSCIAGVHSRSRNATLEARVSVMPWPATRVAHTSSCALARLERLHGGLARA